MTTAAGEVSAQVALSLSSVAVSAVGLAVLRHTRPSRANLGGVSRVYVYRVLGVMGALLNFIGLMLGALPWLQRTYSEDEGKFFLMIQCTLAVACWLIDRTMYGYVKPVHSVGCAIVWFGSTLVEWAGPRPWDSMLTGLSGQASGCDGGYRSPFLIYAATWLTGIMFGTLFLLTVEGVCGSDNDRGDEAESALSDAQSLAGLGAQHSDGRRALRRKMLPIIYGLTTSMSCILLASGTANTDMAAVSFGAILMVVAVVCAWQWLWTLELPLALWGCVSQCFWCILRLVQSHLFFRDFRWNPHSEEGLLIVWKWPGVPLFLLGFFVISFVMIIFVLTPDDNLGVPVPSKDAVLPRNTRHASVESDGGHSDATRRTKSDGGRRARPGCLLLVRVVQWVLFVIMAGSFYLGMTRRILDFEYALPDVQWVQGQSEVADGNQPSEATKEREAAGKSYLQLITTLYDKRLPCSAIVISFNTVVRAPMQFGSFLAVVVGLPCGVHPGLLLKLQAAFVVGQASGWFCNIYVLVFLAAFLNKTGPSGTMDLTTHLGQGFWWFLLYSTVGLLIACSFIMFPETGAVQVQDIALEDEVIANGMAKSRRGSKEKSISTMASICSEEGHSDSDSDGGTCSSEAKSGLVFASFVTLLVIILFSMYLGFTRPFLDFDYRISGVIIKKGVPSVLQLLEEITEMYWGIAYLAMVTLVAVPIAWVSCCAFGLLQENDEPDAVADFVSTLEKGLRPWVHLDLWAVSTLVIYYIVTSRNKATVEICAHFPSYPVSIISICVLFGASKVLVLFPDLALRARVPARKEGVDIGLPGGAWLWSTAVLVTFIFWILFLYFHGPGVAQDIRSLNDVNRMMSIFVQTANIKLKEKIPQSAGDCESFWLSRVDSGKELYSDTERKRVFMLACRGNKPLANVNKGSMSGAAQWATGLDTLQLDTMEVQRPHNVTAVAQEWTAEISGKFTGLHVHMKVDLDNKPWFDDYMCCNNPFHFKLRLSATCVQGQGFQGVSLSVPHLDPIEFQHQVDLVTQDPGITSSYQVNYGSNAAVEENIMDFLTLKKGSLLVKNADGSSNNALEDVAKVLDEIFQMNTGHLCPRTY